MAKFIFLRNGDIFNASSIGAVYREIDDEGYETWHVEMNTGSDFTLDADEHDELVRKLHSISS